MFNAKYFLFSSYFYWKLSGIPRTIKAYHLPIQVLFLFLTSDCKLISYQQEVFYLLHRANTFAPEHSSSIAFVGSFYRAPIYSELFFLAGWQVPTQRFITQRHSDYFINPTYRRWFQAKLTLRPFQLILFSDQYCWFTQSQC